jgi:lysophospholipase L1-like esterase
MTPPPIPSVILIGDSDIFRWPNDVYPTGTTMNLGRNGATLADTRRLLLQQQPSFQSILREPHIAASAASSSSPDTQRTTTTTTTIFVICVGENDLGCGISLESSAQEMESLLHDLLLLQDNNNGQQLMSRRLTRVIFLGPKLEPWLTSDKAARKLYGQLSQMQERSCAKHAKVHFVDCLTLFCTSDSRNYTGRARPDVRFFAADELHLSRQGYMVWQQLVNRTIDDIILAPPQNSSSSGSKNNNNVP